MIDEPGTSGIAGDGAGAVGGDCALDGDLVRATIFVRGQVQGVGFRWWARSRALELGLVGVARNLADGRVEVGAQGTRAGVERLIALLQEESSTAGRPGRVDSTGVQWGEPREGVTGFREA